MKQYIIILKIKKFNSIIPTVGASLYYLTQFKLSIDETSSSSIPFKLIKNTDNDINSQFSMNYSDNIECILYNKYKNAIAKNIIHINNSNYRNTLYESITSKTTYLNNIQDEHKTYLNQNVMNNFNIIDNFTKTRITNANFIINNTYKNSNNKSIPCPPNQYIIKVKISEQEYNLYDIVFNNRNSNMVNDITNTFFEIIITNYNINKINLNTIFNFETCIKQTTTNISRQTCFGSSDSYYIKPLSQYSNYYLIMDNKNRFLKTTSIIGNNIIPIIGLEIKTESLDKIDDSYLWYFDKFIDKQINKLDYNKCLFGGALNTTIKYPEKEEYFKQIVLSSDNKLTKLCSTNYNNFTLINYNNLNKQHSDEFNPYSKCVNSISASNNKSSGFVISKNKTYNIFDCYSFSTIIDNSNVNRNLKDFIPIVRKNPTSVNKSANYLFEINNNNNTNSIANLNWNDIDSATVEINEDTLLPISYETANLKYDHQKFILKLCIENNFSDVQLREPTLKKIDGKIDFYSGYEYKYAHIKICNSKLNNNNLNFDNNIFKLVDPSNDIIDKCFYGCPCDHLIETYNYCQSVESDDTSNVSIISGYNKRKLNLSRFDTHSHNVVIIKLFKVGNENEALYYAHFPCIFHFYNNRDNYHRVSEKTIKNGFTANLDPSLQVFYGDIFNQASNAELLGSLISYSDANYEMLENKLKDTSNTLLIDNDELNNLNIYKKINKLSIDFIINESFSILSYNNLEPMIFYNCNHDFQNDFSIGEIKKIQPGIYNNNNNNINYKINSDITLTYSNQQPVSFLNNILVQLKCNKNNKYLSLDGSTFRGLSSDKINNSIDSSHIFKIKYGNMQSYSNPSGIYELISFNTIASDSQQNLQKSGTPSKNLYITKYNNFYYIFTYFKDNKYFLCLDNDNNMKWITQENIYLFNPPSTAITHNIYSQYPSPNRQGPFTEYETDGLEIKNFQWTVELFNENESSKIYASYIPYYKKSNEILNDFNKQLINNNLYTLQIYIQPNNYFISCVRNSNSIDYLLINEKNDLLKYKNSIPNYNFINARFHSNNKVNIYDDLGLESY